MKYVMLVSMFLGIMLMFWNCSSDSHDSEIKPVAQQGIPELTLALQKGDPGTKTILIQLTVPAPPTAHSTFIMEPVLSDVEGTAWAAPAP